MKRPGHGALKYGKFAEPDNNNTDKYDKYNVTKERWPKAYGDVRKMKTGPCKGHYPEPDRRPGPAH